jgi:oxygen-dependent protoporphyrinogen oxidase
MPRVVIVGGGISGLALAFRLQQRRPDAEVVLLEQEPRLGGKIDTAHRDGFCIEAGPNGFLDTNPAAYDLCRELGLADRLVAGSDAAARNRFLLLHGRLRRLPDSLVSFIASDVLSWPAKVALLAERFRPRRRGGGDESVRAFARRRAGREVADTLVDAVVTGIHAGDPELLSLRAAFPRLAELERDYGSVLVGMARAGRRRRIEAAAAGRPLGRRAAQMWSFREGLRVLIDTLADRLRVPPRLGVTAEGVRRDEAGRWVVHVEFGDPFAADAVVLTCPAYRQAALLGGIDSELAREVAAIAYNRIAVVGLGYRVVDVRHRLDGFGYLSRQRDRRDVLGVQWCSSIFPERAPPGMVLLRALCGGWNRADVVDWDDERLAAAVQAELAGVLGIRATPALCHIVRWDHALPQYHVGHLDHVRRIEEGLGRHPGLFLGGNAYGGVGLNDCVARAAALAEQVVRTLPPTGKSSFATGNAV